LKEYTPEQIFGFGSDVEKFEKIDPGPLGETGDVCFRAIANAPLTPAPITDDVRGEYEFFLTQYILPALEKSKRSAHAGQQYCKPALAKGNGCLWPSIYNIVM
jgi:hypothetical protein